MRGSIKMLHVFRAGFVLVEGSLWQRLRGAWSFTRGKRVMLHGGQIKLRTPEEIIAEHPEGPGMCKANFGDITPCEYRLNGVRVDCDDWPEVIE